MGTTTIKIPKWDIEQETGYKPITTFWMDFSIADNYGLQAIQDTFNRAFDAWKGDYKYLTELVLVLNHKIFHHYTEKGTEEQNEVAIQSAKNKWIRRGEYAESVSGFKDGVAWFKKSIWHDASETPTRYDDYLVRTKQGCVEFIHFANEIWHDKDTGTVDKWLDLHDILPKKAKNENTNL